MKTLSRISIIAALVASLLVTGSPAQATCPKDLAGKLDKEQMPALTTYNFSWSEMFTDTVVGDDDKLVLDLSVIPWPTLSTIFYPLNGGGQEFAIIDMDAEVEGGMAHGVPFEPGKWNDVTVSFDFEAQTYVVNINGENSSPLPFVAVAESIKGLQVYGELGGETATAWLDSVRLRYTPSGGDPTLLHQVSFDDATSYSPIQGTVTSMEPETRVMAAGAKCSSELTLNQDLTQERVKASGKLLPAKNNLEVVVTLYEKEGGNLVKVDRKKPRTNENGRYATSFARPNANTCRLKARFAGNNSLFSDQVVKTFNC